jgi:integrase
MSIRKRKWKSADGLEHEAWVVDYVDQGGKRRNKQFERKKEAEQFETTVRSELRAGIHTADGASVTVSQAGDRWIANCEKAGLERTTVDSYRQHLELHIKPFLGVRKLSQLSVPMITDWERKLRDGTADQKPRSAAMIKRVRSDLGALLGNAQEEGLVCPQCRARNALAPAREKRAGRASRKTQAKGRRRHSDARRDQGHSRRHAGELAANLAHRHFHWPKGLRVARASVGECRSGTT